MKFIITGANGFIGSYLADFLLKKGHEVVGISRKFFPNIREKLSGAELIELDILSTEFEKLNVSGDVLIHLAASNDILSKNLSKGIELSTVGTVNALKFAIYNKIPKFIFYSTLQVLGTELSGKYDGDSKIKPENDYAMNHVFGEQYAEMYSRKFNIKVVVVRPSNIYGRFLTPEIDRWTLVPGCFIKEALDTGNITLLSSGKQFRNFISLEELSNSTEKIAINMQNAFDNLILASNNYCSIIDVAKITQKVLKEKFGKDVELIVKSENPTEPKQFEIDRSNLKSFLIDLNKTFEQSLENEITLITADLLKKAQ
jgi:nucleoside-diphosphate-sugar epimerase